VLEEYVKAGALRFPGIIYEVAELKRGSLMRRLAKAVLVTDTSGGVGLRTVT
jgi:peroxiredoxin